MFEWSNLIVPGATIVGVGGVAWIQNMVMDKGDKRYPSLDTFRAEKDSNTQVVGIVRNDVAALETRSMNRYIENKGLYERLDQKIESVESNTRRAIDSLRTEMTTGFNAVNQNINDGMLKLTKEISNVQGRLAGAQGLTRLPD